MNCARHKSLVLVLLLTAMFSPDIRAQVTITQQPQSQTLPTGASLTLTVQATGTPPLAYQWRLNGVNIPGANNAVFTIPGFQPANSGDYSVAVGDATGALNSDVARVRAANLAVLPFTDEMDGQNGITGLSGRGGGSNLGATRQPGEPNHANKAGAHSVWLTWQPPLLGGVATFDTAGSSFDTLLAVYTGDNLTNLTVVASNDDINTCDDPTGGFHTSRVRFNARPGRVYHIAVDGLSAAAGDIVLSWNLSLLENLLPLLTAVPTAQVGLPGGNVRLSVAVQNLNPVTYQWFLNCESIPDATQPALPLNNLQPSNVGNYIVRVRDFLTGVETATDPATVQINITDGSALDVTALDKFADLAQSVTGNPAAAVRLQKTTSSKLAIRKVSGGLARGYRGTQIFSTVGSTKDPGEPNHCGEAGGASEWYSYQPPASGVWFLDTEGSDFDTVLAVYTGPGTDFQSLIPVACDNNSGSNGKTSKAVCRVTKDTVYYIAVDGVGGASGTVALNYFLNTPPTISSLTAQTTDEDTPVAGVAFTVNDAETAPTNLVVTGSSSNPALVTDRDIIFTGDGTNRTVAFTPLPNRYGTATITITVSDAGGATASTRFLLTVNPVNDPPTISSLTAQTTDEDTPVAGVAFTVNDAETAPTNLVVTGSSSNPALITDRNIIFTGDGTNRTAAFTPLPNRYGTATITITVSDDDGATDSTSFLLTVNPVNDPPTISSISDQSTAEDTPTSPIPFWISDPETSADRLTVTGWSSNPYLVPDENIVFGGSGPSRTVTIVPATNQWGSATITITVTDPEAASASSSFLLTVNPENDPPTMSPVADQATTAGRPTAAIPITVGDVETPADYLTLTGSSSNTNLVPNENIVFGGGGAQRTLTVTPAGSQTGAAVITVTVADTNGGEASRAFMLTVNSGQTLQFLSCSMLTNGTFRLRWTGSPLQNTLLQVSSDLSDWQSVFTNSDQTNIAEWVDSGVSNSAGRFYRAVR